MHQHTLPKTTVIEWVSSAMPRPFTLGRPFLFSHPFALLLKGTFTLRILRLQLVARPFFVAHHVRACVAVSTLPRRL
jgi:hypothetical protein